MDGATTDGAAFDETVVFLSYFNDLQDPRRDRRKFGGASAGGVFWCLFPDLRWTRGLDCEVGENRGRW